MRKEARSAAPAKGHTGAGIYRARSHWCFVEGCAAQACYGLRLPGLRSEQPLSIRDRYLWHCADHVEEARARRDAALAKSVGRAG